MLFRHTVEPLGSFERVVDPAAGLALGVLAVLLASALLEPRSIVHAANALARLLFY